MKRQKLIITTTPDRINIPKLIFYQNTVMIIYDDWDKHLVKYIYVDRVFLIPRALFNRYKNKKYEITTRKMLVGDGDVIGIDCTLNGICFLPGVEDKQKAYERLFYKMIPKPESKIEDNPDVIMSNIMKLGKVKVIPSNYKNIDIKLQRMKDFGDEKQSIELRCLFQRNKDKFEDVSSISLPTNDIGNISGGSLISVDIKYKLADSVEVLNFHGYTTYIDTAFNIYYKIRNPSIMVDLTISKLFISNPEVSIFYSILNWHLNQNINAKIRPEKFYKKAKTMIGEYI